MTAHDIYLAVNAIRATYVLAPDKTLVEQADKRAKQLAESRALSHKGLRDVPCNCRILGENQARGFTSTSTVITAWLTSRKHKDNILDKDYTRTGIGMARSSNGTIYIVQLFSL